MEQNHPHWWTRRSPWKLGPASGARPGSKVWNGGVANGSEEAGLRKEQQRGGHAARAAHGAAGRAGAGARAQGSGGGPGARPPDAERQPGRGRAVPAGPGRVGAGVAGGHRLRRRPAARERNDGLEKRLEELEGVVEAQGKEMRVGRRAAEDAVRAVREEQARALRELETRLSQPQANGSAQGDATPPRPGQPRRRATLRREFPDLVTREPAEEDEEVFADAWPLIVEWREMKAAHPSRGKGPSWLATQERLLTVELALLEEHGMTLPPETYPLRGFARDGQTGWRRQGGSYSGAFSPCGCGGSSRLRVRGVAVNFCEHFGGNLRKGACRASHRGAGPGDNDCAVWLSPRFPTIETWVRGPCCTGMTGG